jgi:hypothetical protein
MLLLAQTTIFVKVVDAEPKTGFNLADVLIRALGVTGVLMVGSLVLGLILGGGFIAYRAWTRKRSGEPEAPTSHLHIAPTLVEYAHHAGAPRGSRSAISPAPPASRHSATP